MFYKLIANPKDGTVLQYLGVYVTRWQPEWSNQPDGYGGTVDTIGFVEDENAQEMFLACEKLIEQYNASPDMTMGGKLTNEPFLRIKAALEKIHAPAQGEV